MVDGHLAEGETGDGCMSVLRMMTRGDSGPENTYFMWADDWLAIFCGSAAIILVPARSFG